PKVLHSGSLDVYRSIPLLVSMNGHKARSGLSFAQPLRPRMGDSRIKKPSRTSRGCRHLRLEWPGKAPRLRPVAQCGVKLGRGNRKDHKRSADEKRWGMGRADLETRILRLRKQGMGIVKVGRTLGVGTSVVQRV